MEGDGMSHATEQERFWAGEFGTDYIGRNTLAALVPARLSLFSRILARTSGVASAMEFGANIGANLAAIHQLLPQAQLKAVEINAIAAKTLQSYPWMTKVVHGSFIEAAFVDEADLTFTCGVLIHVSPDHLPRAYENLYRASRRYVMVCEYYNPTPVALPYRGHADRLFKRDFAGELLDAYKDLELVDYGFAYHRDPVHPMDDVNWFLMKKKA
jgi:pseudaminic acid biosynthesis-associated methylase